jgi:hypothetical protein
MFFSVVGLLLGIWSHEEVDVEVVLNSSCGSWIAIAFDRYCRLTCVAFPFQSIEQIISPSLLLMVWSSNQPTVPAADACSEPSESGSGGVPLPRWF